MVVFACGSNQGDSNVGGPDAGGVDAPPFVPAEHPAPLEFKHLGGPTLAHPSLVTVTWPGDPETDFVRAFDAWIASSEYLRAGLAEYGISAAAYGGAFAFADAAPATIDATDIGQKLADEAAAGHLPPPTADRLYIVYAPPGTTVLRLGFKSCEAFSGTHTSLAVEGGASPIVYSVIPRCHNDFDTDENLLTLASSHETAEAITDPIFTNPAWFTVDPSVSTGAEIADACTDHTDIGKYRVNRLYSNAAARAGKRGCVPAPPGPACGLWATDPALTVPRGGSAETSLHVFFMAPADPELSVLIPGTPAQGKLVEPATPMRAVNGDVVRVRITLPADAPDFFDDVVPLSLSCGTADYFSWYYVHVKLPAP